VARDFNFENVAHYRPRLLSGAAHFCAMVRSIGTQTVARLDNTTAFITAAGAGLGLATAVEVVRRSIACVVVEPRPTVSRSRPRCKPINVRTTEHPRRWGIPVRPRDRVPLPVPLTQALVFFAAPT